MLTAGLSFVLGHALVYLSYAIQPGKGLDGIIWLPMGPSLSGRWGPSVGSLGQGIGYGVHNSGELSGEL